MKHFCLPESFAWSQLLKTLLKIISIFLECVELHYKANIRCFSQNKSLGGPKFSEIISTLFQHLSFLILVDDRLF